MADRPARRFGAGDQRQPSWPATTPRPSTGSSSASGARRCGATICWSIEDLGQLAGKGAAQQELLHLLDDLAGSEAMVVVTARGLPQQISALLAGLRSRLSAGLAVPLALPGPTPGGRFWSGWPWLAG